MTTVAQNIQELWRPFRKSASNILICLFGLFLITACSGSGQGLTVSPGLDPDGLESHSAGNQPRCILAAGRIAFDFQNLTAEFVPLRSAEKHWNVTPMLNPPKCGDCVKITVVEFKPSEKYVKVSIALENPTVLTGYDVRGIAMTDDPDVRLTNADAYTSLWDDGGAVTINPFRAYWTGASDRTFEGSGTDIRDYEFNYKQISGLLNAVLIVDASWQGHAEEPYDIVDQTYSGELTTYSSSSITVNCTALDWQGDVSTVSLDLSELGGTELVQMQAFGSAYTAEITGLEPAIGAHRIRLEAGDSVVSDKIYDYLTVDVSIGAPNGFKLKPGQTFVEASWDAGFDGIQEFHLYKREYGYEFDFGNPIVVANTLTTYMDEDVLAGHMYYYELSAVFDGAETERTSEHGAKPFKWGEIVAVSNIDGYQYYPELNRGLDNSIWAVWDYGTSENLDMPKDPDWQVTNYTLMPGGIFEPNIFADQDGYVYICGADSYYDRIRFIKCHPYDTTPVLIDKYITNYDNDYVSATSVQSSMDSSGTLHLVFEKNPEYMTPPEIYHCTVDKDGNVSEFELVSQVSSEWNISSPYFGVYASPSGKVHVAWLAYKPDTGKAFWRYRVLSDGTWGEEETIAEKKSYNEIFYLLKETLWEDPNGGVYFSISGWFYWYRDNVGWHDKVQVTQGGYWGEVWDKRGGVTGDKYGNVMFGRGFGGENEVSYKQFYGTDWSDVYSVSDGHYPYGPDYDFVNITTDKDGLAVMVWADQFPYGYYHIFARRQVME